MLFVLRQSLVAETYLELLIHLPHRPSATTPGCDAPFVLGHLSCSTGTGIKRESHFRKEQAGVPKRTGSWHYCREVAKISGCVFRLWDVSSAWCVRGLGGGKWQSAACLGASAAACTLGLRVV